MPSGSFNRSSQNASAYLYTILIYIGNCHLPHFEAGLENYTIAIFLKLYVIRNKTYNLYEQLINSNN